MRRLAAVFAHPDDDTFGIGGTLLRHGPEHLDYTLIVATSGEAGLIFEPSLASRDNLAEVREAEQRSAIAVSGFDPERIHFLRHPDGGLAGVDNDALAGEIADILRTAQPEVVVTFGPEGMTGHDDHIAVGAAATKAFHRLRADAAGGAYRRLCYTALSATAVEGYRGWMRSMGQDPGPPDAPFAVRGVPDDTIGVIADVSEVVGRKVEALREHRTQGEELESMPEELVPIAFGIEQFVIAWPAREAGRRQLRDLFEGL